VSGGARRASFPGAEQWVQPAADLETLRAASDGCRGCNLYEDALHMVFGEGSSDARIIVVGEQPGDQEDRQDRPFVGPAGQLLDRALEAAGIDRRTTYVTNAVKHFRFRTAGKRRIHQKPDLAHIRACKPWLDAELAAVQPEVVVVLGATAATALLGSGFRVTQERGTVIDHATETWEGHVVATIHPSAVLRSDDRSGAFDGLVADLHVAAEILDQGAGSTKKEVG